LSKSNEIFETFKQEIEKVNIISLACFICSRPVIFPESYIGWLQF